MSVLGLCGQNAAKAEIAQLHIVTLVEKYISWLEVSMQDHMLLILALTVTFT
jgi:hypothetical protein